MPLYDFHCYKCQKNFEALVDRPSAEYNYKEHNPDCPECGCTETERLINNYGGYRGNLGGASTARRGSGSFRRK